MFIQTIAQTMGPEIMAQFLNPGEYIKRLAAAQGIDVLNLIKTAETMEAEKQQAMQEQMQAQLMQQAGQFANSPMADPSKNPSLGRGLNDGYDNLNAENNTIETEAGAEEDDLTPPGLQT